MWLGMGRARGSWLTPSLNIHFTGMDGYLSRICID